MRTSSAISSWEETKSPSRGSELKIVMMAL